MADGDSETTRATLAPAPARARAPRRPHKVRYTDAEWARVERSAQLVGRAPARYVREVSLGAVPRAPRSRADAALLRELGRVGLTLSQLSAELKSGDAASSRADDVDAALAELLVVVRRIG